MKLRSRLKDLQIAGKLRAYRTCMIALIGVMGVVSIILSVIMYSRITEITQVWSPSLSCVQQINTLVSDYRLKQYGHLVATDTKTMSSYETETKKCRKSLHHLRN